jgi:hypothetical protein
MSETNADKNKSAQPNTSNDQLLHLVFGGELDSLDEARFKDPAALDIVGIFPNYARARDAWKSAAQKTVDNAQMRYFIVHIHKLLDPAADPTPKA